MGNGIVYSFILGRSSELYKGIQPLTEGVGGLLTSYTGRLFSSPALPNTAIGSYEIIVGLTPPGTVPNGLDGFIPRYWAQEEIAIER